jgi:ferredoxin
MAGRYTALPPAITGDAFQLAGFQPHEDFDVPKLTIEGRGTFDIPEGTRLVRALTDQAGTDQLHACGGKARCTTCRVEFIEGEPDSWTVAERDLLAAKGLQHAGLRLSCQILCDHDMSVRLISRFEGSGRKDAGSPVADALEPAPAQWLPRS